MKVNKIIYCFWTGDNQLTPNRINGLKTMKENLNVDIKLIDKNNLNDYIIPEHPLHDGYKYLSLNHKSDYLRCYFMNFYGGGYSDIKPFSKENNWSQCFDIINSNNETQIIGSKECINGAAFKEYNKPNIIKCLLQNGWFICRKNSNFTKEWYKRLIEKMNERYESLKMYPSTSIFGGDKYKLRWAEIQGEIFHKLLYETYNPKTIKNCLISGRLGGEYR